MTNRFVCAASFLVFVVTLLALTGCGTASEHLNKRPPVDVLTTGAVQPQPVVVTPIGNGPIFQAGL